LAARRIRIGGHRYEHTEPLVDGRVRIEGVEAEFESATLVSDTFYKMIRGDYDVAELGLTYFLRMWDTDRSPFVALPIFPNRNFRHSAIYVSAASGITRPEQLAGRTVGEFALYGHDAGVWPKGILSDEYGFDPAGCRWVIGGTNVPIPAFDWLPQPIPAGVDVRHAPDGVTLASLLESGEIDALVSIDVPRALLRGDATVRRLFPDHEHVERDYYRRTGIFPPMHVIAIRRELASDADLVQAVYRAYVESKELVQQAYLAEASKQHMSVMTPWFSSLFARNLQLFGEDWWPYGLARNKKAIDTFLRYHHEQGLSRELLVSEDVFAPALHAS
jgi:4,5-dihydroxyphthalate decarboxylase